MWKTTTHLWLNVDQFNSVKNLPHRSIYLRRQSYSSVADTSSGLSEEARKARGYEYLVAFLIVHQVMKVFRGLGKGIDRRFEENSFDELYDRSKRCESAKADLEMLEREVDAIKAKLPARARYFGPSGRELIRKNLHAAQRKTCMRKSEVLQKDINEGPTSKGFWLKIWKAL